MTPGLVGLHVIHFTVAALGWIQCLKAHYITVGYVRLKLSYRCRILCSPTLTPLQVMEFEILFILIELQSLAEFGS